MVNAAAFRLGLNADQFVRKTQRDQQTGGNVVAADQSFRFLLDDNLAADLIRDGYGIGYRGGSFCFCRRSDAESASVVSALAISAAEVSVSAAFAAVGAAAVVSAAVVAADVAV